MDEKEKEEILWRIRMTEEEAKLAANDPPEDDEDEDEDEQAPPVPEVYPDPEDEQGWYDWLLGHGQRVVRMPDWDKLPTDGCVQRLQQLAESRGWRYRAFGDDEGYYQQLKRL
jgi:hypothetical protein